jgi:hypothetical protein
MGIRFSGMVLAVVTTAFVIAPGSSALAQLNVPGAGGPNTGDRMGGGGGGKGGMQTATKNLNTSRSNVNRMGGGGGGKGAAGQHVAPFQIGKQPVLSTTVNPGKSSSSDRMGGGGGGKGAPR